MTPLATQMAPQQKSRLAPGTGQLLLVTWLFHSADAVLALVTTGHTEP